MTITVVILGVLIGTTRMTMDTWKESRDRARAATQAKEGLDILAKDLEGAVIREGNDFEWMYVAMDDNGDEMGPSSGEIKNPIEFCFLSAATDRYDGKIGTSDDEGGDISAVIYRLVYKDQFNGDYPVYSLYRQLVNPDETFEDFLAQTDLSTNVDSDDVISASNFVAENIYNLSVTLVVEYTDDSGATPKIVRTRLPIIDGGAVNELRVIGGKLVGAANSEIIPGEPEARIVSMEIGAVVLNDSAMNSLSKKSFTDASFEKLLKENSHYFTKSVLMARP